MVRCRQPTEFWALALFVVLGISSSSSAFSLTSSPLRSRCTCRVYTCCRPSTIRISVLALSSDSGSAIESPKPSNSNDHIAPVRQLRCFSVTALRTTVRAATGVSLTALYASTVAISGIWIRQTMKVILSVFPSWARYFVQPFLIMYYVPLYMLRSLSSPQRALYGNDPKTWNTTVQSTGTDEKASYWPINVVE